MHICNGVGANVKLSNYLYTKNQLTGRMRRHLIKIWIPLKNGKL